MLDISKYIETERLIHNWIRFLGAYAEAYIEPQEGDAHTNLNWNKDKIRFETRRAPNGLFMTYSPIQNGFQFLNEPNSKLFIVLHLSEKSVSEVKTEIQEILTSMDFDTTDLFSNLEFRYLEHHEESKIMNVINQREMLLQNEIRTITHDACTQLLEYFQCNSEIRVWPHNFDTGIYCKHKNGLEQFAGYSPGDSEVSEIPYFYNGFYKGGAKVYPENYPQLIKGYWETKKWGGAILPFTEHNEVCVTEFFIRSTQTFLIKNS